MVAAAAAAILYIPMNKEQLRRHDACASIKDRLASGELCRDAKLTARGTPFADVYEALRTDCVSPLLKLLFSIRAQEEGLGLLCGPLISQASRSATSATANLMEGIGKVTDESMHVFVRIARGSLWETLDHMESLRVLLEAADMDCSELVRLKLKFHRAAEMFDTCYIAFLENCCSQLLK